MNHVHDNNVNFNEFQKLIAGGNFVQICSHPADRAALSKLIRLYNQKNRNKRFEIVLPECVPIKDVMMVGVIFYIMRCVVFTRTCCPPDHPNQNGWSNVIKKWETLLAFTNGKNNRFQSSGSPTKFLSKMMRRRLCIMLDRKHSRKLGVQHALGVVQALFVSKL